MGSASARFKSSPIRPGRLALELIAALAICGACGTAFASPAIIVSPSPSAPVPSAAPSISPIPALAASPVPSPSPTPLSEEQRKTLLREFQKAQRTELKALDHRQKMELTELKASQKVRVKEWDTKENEARRKFFNDHPKGADKRAYMRDLHQRRDAFQAILKDERDSRAHDYDVRRKSLVEEQAARLKEFQGYLELGQEPPRSLW